MKLTLFICVVSFLFGLILASVELLSKSPEIRRFQQYVQIDTETGKSLRPAVSFWSKLALLANVKFSVREYVTNYPVVMLKWPGKNSSLSSIILTTNMDTTPADVRDGWTYPPFSAYIDQNGTLYGRGSQVIKSTSMQHYEALLRLKQTKGLRDVYMVLTPDEESGSKNGLVPFLKSKEFEDMNAEFFLRMGEPTQKNEILVLYQGKTRWTFKITCSGPSGTTSQLVTSTTSSDGQCGRFYECYTNYRNKQVDLYTKGMDLSNITVINFAGPEVRTTVGVVPDTISMYFDTFLAIGSSLCEFEEMVNGWVASSGNGTVLETIVLEITGPAVVTKSYNPYWNSLQKASKIVNIPFKAATYSDAGGAYITRAGYPVFGVSPLNNTENLIHAVNERINILTFYNGIKIFEEIITKLMNIPANILSDDPSYYLEY